ncbi:MAG: hypothetical protein R2756_12990 [Bacteroidales bacterium]
MVGFCVSNDSDRLVTGGGVAMNVGDGHVTVVDPTGNCAGALFVTVATPQLSAVVGVPKSNACGTRACICRYVQYVCRACYCRVLGVNHSDRLMAVLP